MTSKTYVIQRYEYNFYLFIFVNEVDRKLIGYTNEKEYWS